MMSKIITIFLCGDVMLGRGIDQILPNPGHPQIHEPSLKDARGYVELAERINGKIPYPVSFSYIWGDALDEFQKEKPDVKLINLETSITKNDDYWERKDVHYRMHPENVSCLKADEIDFCALANNHILDWGYKGLIETLETLHKIGVKNAGAGKNLQEATKPAVIEIDGKGRVIVFSFGLRTSGIPMDWAALEDKPGVYLLLDLSEKTVENIKEKVQKIKQSGDIVVASIHWGGNWGYEVSDKEREFAHKLIDIAGIDVIHGHSSHHVKALELYKKKLIIYGCGDFLNDYEGIRGYEEFKDDLGLMYFLYVDSSTGKLVDLKLISTQIKHFKVNKAEKQDAIWLRNVLNRESGKYGVKVELDEDCILKWNKED